MCSIVNKMWSYEIWKSLNFVFIYILHVIRGFFGIGFVFTYKQQDS